VEIANWSVDQRFSRRLTIEFVGGLPLPRGQGKSLSGNVCKVNRERPAQSLSCTVARRLQHDQAPSALTDDLIEHMGRHRGGATDDLG
jgi:hypothetical protein